MSFTMKNVLYNESANEYALNLPLVSSSNLSLKNLEVSSIIQNRILNPPPVSNTPGFTVNNLIVDGGVNNIDVNIEPPNPPNPQTVVLYTAVGWQTGPEADVLLFYNSDSVAANSPEAANPYIFDTNNEVLSINCFIPDTPKIPPLLPDITGFIMNLDADDKYYVQYPLGNSTEYTVGGSPSPSNFVNLRVFNGSGRPPQPLVFIPGNPIKPIFAMIGVSNFTQAYIGSSTAPQFKLTIEYNIPSPE
jgi:hypothetical protein